MKTVFKKLRVFKVPSILIGIILLLWIPFVIGFGTTLFFFHDYIARHEYAELVKDVAVIVVPPIAYFVILRIIAAIKLSVSLKAVIPNTKEFLPDVTDNLISDVEKDIAGGMRFEKKGQIGMSENYIFGNLRLKGLSPVIIPVSEVVEVLYESFEGDITRMEFNGNLYDKADFYQYLFFRLRNGNYVPVLINDEEDTGSSIQALRDAGIEIVILNRLIMQNAVRSKDKILSFIKEKERIIVRSSDSAHIIPLPVEDGCTGFEKLFYDPQDRLIATAECEDGSSVKYVIDEMTLTLKKE